MPKLISFAVPAVTSAARLDRTPELAATSGRCRPALARSISRCPSCGARPSRPRSSNATAGGRVQSRKRWSRCNLAGISVRRVEDITEALWGTRVSPSTVSNLNKKIYAKIEAWRNRPIEGEHPYLFLDGIVMKRTWAGEVRNVSLLVASAVNSEGFREILGICEGAKEDKSGWSAFLRHLVDRGLQGVRLIISDACRGLMESAGEYLPDAQWQRCMVHFYRNVFSHVPATRVREVSHMLKAIHAQENRGAADRKARAIVDDLRAAKMNTAADLVERSVGETLTYYTFPDIHWQKIRTNNPLERIMREIRRRTRVVGAFPDGQSCLNLAAARLRYIAGSAWSIKRYMNMRPLYQPQVIQTGAVA